jgi:hypothetical protein
LLPACADTGQDRVTVPLLVAGTDASDPVRAAGDVSVQIDRADLAFGPLYLCAGSQAGDFCDTARLEWLDSLVIDATDAEPRRAGDLDGVTGLVRSWMVDLGISSVLTDSKPVVLDAARELGGVSLVLEARADVDGIPLPFRAEIPIAQGGEAEQGVPVVRQSMTPHDVQVGEPGLLVRFDPGSWLRDVDLSAYVEDAVCTEAGPEFVCAGLTEQICAPDGTTVSTRDCEALGQICVAGAGCEEQLVIEPNSQAYRALRNALVSRDRPVFEWGASPE